MAKRGRPRKYGLQPAWMLLRAIIVLDAFNEARRAGEKYETAISAAVAAVKKRYPEMRIGPRRAKGILAEFQPEGSANTFLPEGSANTLLVNKIPECQLQSPEIQRSLAILHSLGFPEGKKLVTYTISVGPRPKYTRHNAERV